MNSRMLSGVLCSLLAILGGPDILHKAFVNIIPDF